MTYFVPNNKSNILLRFFSKYALLNGLAEDTALVDIIATVISSQEATAAAEVVEAVEEEEEDTSAVEVTGEAVEFTTTSMATMDLNMEAMVDRNQV